MTKVIIFVPLAGYRPYSQMVEALTNAKNYLVSVTNQFELRDFYCKVFPIHANRNACVGHAVEGFQLDNGERWMPDISIWIDADTVIPYDGLLKLLNPDYKIMSGLYRLKKEPYHELVFRRWKYDVEGDIWVYLPITDYGTDIFPADSVGMGCARVDVDILAALDPPHFKYQRPSRLEAGEHEGLDFLIKWYVETNTEEAWFWRKVVDKGFDIWVDPTIKCKHMTEVPIDDKYIENLK